MCVSVSAYCFISRYFSLSTVPLQGRSCKKWTKSAASTAQAAATVNVSQSHPVRSGGATYTQTRLEINSDDLSPRPLTLAIELFQRTE